MKAKASTNSKDVILDILKGTLIAIISSLIGVLVLALIVKFSGISEKVILPVNQVIKVISILVGCLFGIKHNSNGAFKGAVIGFLYTIISVFVFLILNKHLNANSFNVIDFIAGIIAGTVSGIIAVNFRKK